MARTYVGLAEALLGLDGFRVLEVTETADEVTITIETTVDVVGCGGCGTRAEAQDRMPIHIRDLACFGRPTRLVWIKRRWRCVDRDCHAKTWTEHSDHVDAQVVLTRAVINPDPTTGRPSPLAGVTVVVDPFHIVRLANTAVTTCHQRVQQATVEHRGWKSDPVYDIRKLLLLGAERVDEVTDCWGAKEKVRSIYLTEDPDLAAERLDDALAWCCEPEAGPELRRLAKVLRRWREAILAHHHTGASNGPVEAANLLIKQVKRSGRGFRNVTNYRLRILLASGANPTRETHTVTSIRTRRPRLVA